MKRALILGAMAVGALAIPASPALADHGSTCDYASGQAVTTGDVDPTGGQIVVYAGDGMSGSATAAAGACLNTNTVGVADVEGGTGEAGAGISSDGLPGVYAIVDGDNDNVDPVVGTSPSDSQSDGYIGLSNFETGARGDVVSETLSCVTGGPDNAGNSGTNSGGCLGPDGSPVFVPVPLVSCGNSSGNTWDATNRDGCSVP